MLQKSKIRHFDRGLNITTIRNNKDNIIYFTED